MKVPAILENEFKNLGLKKLRLKTDPANPVSGYVGYFLNENEDGTIKMYVIGATQPFMDISPSDIDLGASLSNIDKLKLMLAETIKDRNLLLQIKNLNSINDIEGMLLSNGYSFEDLYVLLKNFFCMCDDTVPVSEGVLSSLGRGWNKLKSGVQSAEQFSKGDYGAFAQPKPEKQKEEPKKPGLQPITDPGDEGDDKRLYTKTKFDLDEPMPIDTINWQIVLSSDKKKATFTLKQELAYGGDDGKKMYSPNVLEVFEPGVYFIGDITTTTSKGAPIKTRRGHYYIKPSTIEISTTGDTPPAATSLAPSFPAPGSTGGTAPAPAPATATPAPAVKP